MKAHTIDQPIKDVTQRPLDAELFDLVCELGVLRMSGHEIDEGHYQEALRAYHADMLERLGATSSVEPSLLTRTQLASALGVSPRRVDEMLRDVSFVEAIGGYKTSPTKNGHWRFPSDAASRGRDWLRSQERVVA
jgi:hypothetical protein